MVNMENYCRLCLDVNPTTTKHISILEDPTVLLHLKSCLAVTITPNDILPKEMCVSCVSQLNEFYNFQLNARCSQDWLESCLQEKNKKTIEKTHVHPLPDSEYNSDSLLEFLNNTANIEEYLNNLGREDIPSIVSMLDRTESETKKYKIPSPKKNELPTKKKLTQMDVDILDSDVDVVKEILMKETEPKKTTSTEKGTFACFACKTIVDSIQKLSQHFSICDNASRTCIYCNILFNSKQKMREHLLSHNRLSPLTCNCGMKFGSKEKMLQHYKNCNIDHIAAMGFIHRCKQCGQTFRDRFHLYRHAREHVLKTEAKVCDICGHKFIGNDMLLKHRKDQHNQPDKCLYKCKICNKSLSDRKEMYIHVKKHTESKELHKHLCESCGRSFATKAILLRHTQQHSKRNDYQCSICDLTFSEARSRDEHVLGHVEKAICDKCGQSVNRYKLDAHVCM